MQDIDIMIGQVVGMLMSNADLLSLLDPSPNPSPFNPSGAPIFGYSPAGNTNTALDDAIQAQPNGTIMIAWDSLDTTKSRGMEAYTHTFLIYISPSGPLSPILTKLMNGACANANNFPFRMSQPNPRCLPVSELSFQRRTNVIAENVTQFDFIVGSFKLIERGADTTNP